MRNRLVSTLTAFGTYGILSVIAGTLLSGCSWLSHEKPFETQELKELRELKKLVELRPEKKSARRIEVAFIASIDVNPNADAQAQPIKVCVIEVSVANWMPTGMTDGAPCRDEPLSGAVLGRNQIILQANEQRNYYFDVPVDQDRWIVVAAEFQQISGALRLIERKSAAGNDSKVTVMVGASSFSIAANDKKVDE